MKFAIYTSGHSYLNSEDLTSLLSLSQQLGFTLSFNEPFALYAAQNYGVELQSYSSAKDIEADFMVTYGGDGTFLHCVALLEQRQIPILGINSGRMGFLSSACRDDFATAFQAMISGDYTIENRSMIEVSGDFGEEGIFPHVFNEFTVQKSELNMISVSVCVDEKHIATFAADGVIVSTPSGSTAYSLSAGGSIIAPSCKAFIITPIAPHNLTVRPIVIDEQSKVSIVVYSHIDQCYATLDNRSYLVKNGAQFSLQLSPKCTPIVQLASGSFYDTLRKKLMWASETERASL